MIVTISDSRGSVIKRLDLFAEDYSSALAAHPKAHPARILRKAVDAFADRVAGDIRNSILYSAPIQGEECDDAAN